MGLIEQAQKDSEAIVTNSNEFAQPIIIQSTSTGITVEVNALINNVHDKIDIEGNPVHSKNVVAIISELALNKLNYPVRDENNEVDMNGDKITYTDLNGNTRRFIIKSKLPDEVFGSLHFQLSDLSEC